MRRERVLRFEVPTREALATLVSGALPDEVAGAEVQVDFFREVYFDTPTRDLAERGAAIWLRIRKDGTRTLGIDILESEVEGKPVARSHAEAEVPEGEPAEIFAGPSEPARLLRALIDPARLCARLELETLRRSRSVWSREDPARKVELQCNAVTLRRGETTAEFFELEVHLSDQVERAAEMVRRLEEGLGLRVTLADRLARAQEVLEALELDRLEHAVRSAHQVAVVVQRDGAIAFRRQGEALRIPTGQGSGAEACRQVLRTTLGRTQGRVRLLGTSSGLGARPAVEVWLAQHPAPDGDDAPAADLVWLPLGAAVARVGTAALRDSATLAALNTAVRMGIADEPADVWSGRTTPREKHPFHLRRETRAGAGAPAGAGEMELDLRKRSGAADLLLNADVSELAFNERVLALAEDPRTPLLERVRFLSILGSNLDGFFMTRVAGFQQQVASGSTKLTLDGLTAQEQLDVIGVRARSLFQHAYHYLWNTLVPRLEEAGIQLLEWDGLDERERAYLRATYAVQLGAVLTPLAADPSHPFPHIRNLRPALGVIVRVAESQAEHFAAIELPGDLPRFLPLPGGLRFLPIEKLIAATLPALYGGLEVVEAHAFRVTRSANFTLDDEEVSDLLAAVEEKVLQRPLGPVVRLEVEKSMPAGMRELLLREIQFEPRQRVSTLRAEDVYAADRLVDLYGLHEVAALPVEGLHYPPLQRTSPLRPRPSIWRQLRQEDVLVQFPQHSFEATVERLLAEAARDPDVISVKITLYRTSRASRVVKLLRRARRQGKDVAALVELKASFDERRNIEWARMLESSGIHVVFSPAHLKVHAKICLVVRREGDALRRYSYIGTGNLNAATAAAYTDLGLLTCDPELGEELHDVFNGLTGYSTRTAYDHLLVAPFNMRSRFIGMIEREAEHARAGRGGHIRVKINGLTDREIIEALYRASAAGVRIELIVRGLCALRPGLPGLSENIGVVSVLGRFLEHSRIFRFENAGAPEYFIGSADWRPRNLGQRVEVVTPVRDPDHRAVLDGILEANLRDPHAWELRPDGDYVQRPG